MATVVTPRQAPPSNPPAKVAAKGAPHGDMLIHLVTSLLVISSLAVALRYYVRFFRVKAWGLDDLFISLALVSAMGMTACFIVQANLGSPLGISGITPPTMKASFSSFLIYWPTIWAVKMSVLSFCYRIFRELTNSRVIVVIRGAMVVVTIHSFVAFAMFLFACPKISTNWNPKVFPRGCTNLCPLQIAHAAVSGFTDAFVLAIPIVMLARTQFNRKRRAFAIGIFSLGFMALLASISRLISLIVFNTRPVPPGNWVLVPIFASLEVNIAITSASLPSLSPLIKSAACAISQLAGTSPASGSQTSQWRHTGPLGRHTEAKTDNANMVDVKTEIRVEYNYMVDCELGELSNQSRPFPGSESERGPADASGSEV